MCFLRLVLISSLGILTRAGLLGDGCSCPGLQGWGLRDTWTRCRRGGTSGWLLGMAKLGLPIDRYDLVTGVFVLGAVITCAS